MGDLLGVRMLLMCRRGLGVEEGQGVEGGEGGEGEGRWWWVLVVGREEE